MTYFGFESLISTYTINLKYAVVVNIILVIITKKNIRIFGAKFVVFIVKSKIMFLEKNLFFDALIFDFLAIGRGGGRRNITKTYVTVPVESVISN